MNRKERRTSPRIRKRLKVLITDPADALEEPRTGWLVDCSQEGVCLASHRTDIAEGDLLLLQPAAGNALLPWITVQVKNRRPKASRVELGCQFVQRQEWAKMLMLE